MKAFSSFVIRFLLIAVVTIGMVGVHPVQPVLASATLTVSNTNDSGSGSLRQAIASAASGDTIVFDSSLSGKIIALASTLVIDKNLTIDGSSLASRISISGNNSVKVFNLTKADITVTLDSLMILNGSISTSLGGGLENKGTLTIKNSDFSANTAAFGGAIINRGTLIISESTFSGNTATGAPSEPSAGGAILNLGTLKITNGTFTDNTADSGGSITNYGPLSVSNSIFSGNHATQGGALDNNSDGFADITTSTFSNNSAQSGGGIVNYETLNISNSNITANTGTYGGGIYNYGILNLTNSMLSENIADEPNTTSIGGAVDNTGQMMVTGSTFIKNTASGFGGAIQNTSILTVSSSTFSENTSDGIFNNGTLNITSSTISGALSDTTHYRAGIINAGTLNFSNMILANSVTSSDCRNLAGYGIIGVNVNNLIETNAAAPNNCGTPSFTADPKLAPLANNGGPTQTMALASDSPAVNAGSDANCPATDQRGIKRPQGSHCDIGAYEYSGTFFDVPLDYWAWSYIERVYAAKITGGCSTSPLNYCPGNTVTRAQMAIFLLRAEHGADYVPPAATGMFSDVPKTDFAAPFIEQLATEQITGGCSTSPLNYCPNNPVTRAQMAIFLLRAEHGFDYTPPAATGAFLDVPKADFTAPFIEQLATEQITGGCGGGNYCPAKAVTRDQMAIFLVRAFKLP